MKARLYRTAAEVALERQQRVEQPTEEHDTLAASEADDVNDKQSADDEPKPRRRTASK
jgi:hypothetical protein